jgi:DNA polymerase-4
MQTILYVEMPNFYASIERADHPELVDRPIIVGGDPRKKGLVQSATADARAAGVSTEMPVMDALRRCPEARAFRTNMVRYREVSRQLFAWLRRGVERLEPSGLGAAYFDLSLLPDPATEIAASLQAVIQKELGLPLRAGIGSGRLIARVAAEEVGEGTLRAIPPGEEAAFLAPFPATRLEGVGEKTAMALAELGATTIGEVAALPAAGLEAALGPRGLLISELAAGRDGRPGPARGPAPRVSRESGGMEATRDLAQLTEGLQDLAQKLVSELARQGLLALKIALKVEFSDQAAVTRSLTLAAASASAAEIHEAALRLLERTDAGSRPVTRLRVQLSELQLLGAEDRQLELFSSSA